MYLIIEANTGNGSWLGLGALLLGMFAIPVTAIVNFVHIRNNKDKPVIRILMHCFAFTLVAPLLILVS